MRAEIAIFSQNLILFGAKANPTAFKLYYCYDFVGLALADAK